MGLFSFGKKTKQDTVRDSGHFVKEDDAAYTERARSKRASHGGQGERRSSPRQSDPLLPEKKRARRRLVGAIALALAAAVALPMLLDAEPMSPTSDIEIRIPDQSKAQPLPVPQEPAVDAIAAAASVDEDEEIIDPPPSPPLETRNPVREVPVTPPVQVAQPAQDSAERKQEQEARLALENRQRLEQQKRLEAERKREADKRLEAEKKLAAEKKPARTPEAPAKPVAAAHRDDSDRALAILEGKATVQAEHPAPRYVVQVAALASPDKVSELRQRLSAAGIDSFTQKAGELIRVRIGPMSKEEAEKVRAKLSAAGLSGSLVPL